MIVAKGSASAHLFFFCFFCFFVFCFFFVFFLFFLFFFVFLFFVFLFFLFFVLFCFVFFAISLVWLLGRIYNGSIIVAWMYLFLFCVTTNVYWHILLRFGFWHTYAPNFLSFTLSMYTS